MRFELDLRDLVEQGIFLEDYERELVSFWCANVARDRTVLDVGANVGLYSLLAAARGARAIAFEPHPGVRARLEANVEQNGFGPLITVRHEALAERRGQATLFADWQFGRPLANSGLASLSARNAGGPGIAVDVRTLDDVVEEYALGDIDLVKMDIQGAELLALRGARRTLTTFRPTIILEFDSVAAENLGWTWADLEHFLGEIDYEARPLYGLNVVATPR